MISLSCTNSYFISWIDENLVDIEIIMTSDSWIPFESKLHSSLDNFRFNNSQFVDMNKPDLKLFAVIHRIIIRITKLNIICPWLPSSSEVSFAFIIDNIDQILYIFTFLDFYLEILCSRHLTCFFEITVRNTVRFFFYLNWIFLETL